MNRTGTAPTAPAVPAVRHRGRPVRQTVVVLGPTASGKSEVAMALTTTADDIEIVAVDSMQVYRGMDIGTAKPTAADRATVTHHCLDLVDADVDFTVAEYATHARRALDDIAARGRRAVLVAGTGLYLRAITDPLEIPGRWPEVRRHLDQRLVTEGSPALHAELADLDPTAAERMEPTNARRVVRALEVVIGSGRPFSSFGPGLVTYPETDITQVGVRWPRALLAQRITARVEAMVDAGLLAEVEALAGRPAGVSRTARQAIGYGELLDHLDGRCSLDEAIATTITRTRQFAVRQERWFRRDPRIRWVTVTADPAAAIVPLLR